MSTNPFYGGTYYGRDTYHISADCRLRALKDFTLEQCQAALERTDLQKTVRTALERRIRKLQQEPACSR